MKYILHIVKMTLFDFIKDGEDAARYIKNNYNTHVKKSYAIRVNNPRDITIEIISFIIWIILFHAVYYLGIHRLIYLISFIMFYYQFKVEIEIVIFILSCQIYFLEFVNLLNIQ